MPPKVILVVEDEPNIVSVIKQSLRGVMVEVVATDNGERGVELAARIEPDLILLDLALPGISGWEALETIRGTAHGSQVPVAIVTAHGDSETAVRAREAGADEFLTKPFQPGELRRLVTRMLEAGPSAA